MSPVINATWGGNHAPEMHLGDAASPNLRDPVRLGNSAAALGSTCRRTLQFKFFKKLESRRRFKKKKFSSTIFGWPLARWIEQLDFGVGAILGQESQAI